MAINYKRRETNPGAVVADKDYLLDKNGEITNDTANGEHWIARKGGLISKADQDKYRIPTAGNGGEVAQEDEAEHTSDEAGSKSKSDGKKATAPAKNKKAKGPSENKGVK